MEDELYRQNILDHNRNPRNYGKLSVCDIRESGKNANCGDDVTLYIKFGNNDIVSEISFDGYGCAISKAGASMLTEYAKGKSIDELRSTTEDDIYKMFGVQINPGRKNCALLAYKTLQKILKKYA